MSSSRSQSSASEPSFCPKSPRCLIVTGVVQVVGERVGNAGGIGSLRSFLWVEKGRAAIGVNGVGGAEDEDEEAVSLPTSEKDGEGARGIPRHEGGAGSGRIGSGRAEQASADKDEELKLGVRCVRVWAASGWARRQLEPGGKASEEACVVATAVLKLEEGMSSNMVSSED